MTKQKMVVKLMLGDAKKRRKALKTAVIMDGVVSVTLNDDKLEVIGDGTDSVTLTIMLRKKLGYADLISVTEEKEEKNKDDKKENKLQGENQIVYPFIYPYKYMYSYPSTY